MTQRYPLMPLTKGLQPFKDKHGSIIVVNSEAEEKSFFAEHQDAEPVPEFVEPKTPEQVIEELKAENAALQAENEALRKAAPAGH